MRDEQQKAEELYMEIGKLILKYSGAEIANALTKCVGITLGHQKIEERDYLLEKIIEGIVGYDQMFRDAYPEFKLPKDEK